MQLRLAGGRAPAKHSSSDVRTIARIPSGLAPQEPSGQASPERVGRGGFGAASRVTRRADGGEDPQQASCEARCTPNRSPRVRTPGERRVPGAAWRTQSQAVQVRVRRHVCWLEVCPGACGGWPPSRMLSLGAAASWLCHASQLPEHVHARLQDPLCQQKGGAVSLSSLVLS